MQKIQFFFGKRTVRPLSGCILSWFFVSAFSWASEEPNQSDEPIDEQSDEPIDEKQSETEKEAQASEHTVEAPRERAPLYEILAKKPIFTDQDFACKAKLAVSPTGKIQSVRPLQCPENLTKQIKETVSKWILQRKDGGPNAVSIGIDVSATPLPKGAFYEQVQGGMESTHKLLREYDVLLPNEACVIELDLAPNGAVMNLASSDLPKCFVVPTNVVPPPSAFSETFQTCSAEIWFKKGKGKLRDADECSKSQSKALKKAAKKWLFEGDGSYSYRLNVGFEAL